MKGKRIDKCGIFYKDTELQYYIRYKKNNCFNIEGVDEKDNHVFNEAGLLYEEWESVIVLKKEVSSKIEELALKNLRSKSKKERVILYYYENIERDDFYFDDNFLLPSLSLGYRVVYKIVSEGHCLGYELVNEKGESIPTFGIRPDEKEVPYNYKIEEFFNEALFFIKDLGKKLEDTMQDELFLKLYSKNFKLVDLLKGSKNEEN